MIIFGIFSVALSLKNFLPTPLNPNISQNRYDLKTLRLR